MPHDILSTLVQCHEDRPATTTSLIVAERFGKRHTEVLRAIAKLECSDEFRRRNFASAEYLDEQGKPRPMTEMTRDGFAFLAMGFTGKEAALWKEQFIAAFNALEAEVLENRRRDIEWEAAHTLQARHYWFPKRPRWETIRELVIVYSLDPPAIAKRTGFSVSSVRRAIHMMIEVGILHPRLVRESIRHSAFARSLTKSGVIARWGKQAAEQFELFG